LTRISKPTPTLPLWQGLLASKLSIFIGGNEGPVRVQSLAQWGGFRNEDFAPAHLVWALAAGVLPSRATRAQGTYPGSQTIKLIVGFPAGGSQDNVGRILADRLSAYRRASVLVENVAGAGSISPWIGSQRAPRTVAKS
jgi:hypothetical protein